MPDKHCITIDGIQMATVTVCYKFLALESKTFPCMQGLDDLRSRRPWQGLTICPGRDAGGLMRSRDVTSFPGRTEPRIPGSLSDLLHNGWWTRKSDDRMAVLQNSHEQPSVSLPTQLKRAWYHRELPITETLPFKLPKLDKLQRRLISDASVPRKGDQQVCGFGHDVL